MPLIKYSRTFRSAASYPHKVLVRTSSVEDAKRWATCHTKHECIYTGWHGNVTFHFDHPNDAMMFKLMFG